MAADKLLVDWDLEKLEFCIKRNNIMNLFELLSPHSNVEITVWMLRLFLLEDIHSNTLSCVHEQHTDIIWGSCCYR